MHYKCNRCGYEEIEYSTVSHPCPNCGETVLMFHHVGYLLPDHWVIIDTKTNTVIGGDMCDMPAEKIHHPVYMMVKL